MAQESQAEEQQLIFGAVWIEGKGEVVGRGNGVAGDCIPVSLIHDMKMLGHFHISYMTMVAECYDKVLACLKSSMKYASILLAIYTIYKPSESPLHVLACQNC